ncbi:MAG: outer membrane beta-barrel protein [Bacteroidales bacterium]|nr:outer membrane beta-barrel protein [Bacteroidales bacterium]
MADKNWKDSLRERMQEFEQTPPEGLWEAIESSGAVGRKAGAAGAGLLARLLGGSRAPLWWSLAGVAAAAAVAVVLLLRTPGAENPIVTGSEATVAEVVDSPEDDFGTVEDASATDLDQASEDSPAASSAALTQKAPVMSTAPAKIAPSYSKQAGFEYGLEPDASEVAPDAVDSASDATEAAPNAADSAPDAAEAAPAASDSEAPSTDASESAPVVPNQTENPAATDAVPAGDPAPSGKTVSPSFQPKGRTVVPLSRSIKRSRPLLAASFVGGGMPGSSATNSEIVYSLSPAPRMSPGNRAMAVVSRNKETQVVTSHRIDYQMGLMFTYNFTRHWGIESGVELTHLGSSKTSTSGSLSTGTQESFDYLGIPLRVVFTPLSLGPLSGYISAGPEAEYGFSHLWRTVESFGQTTSEPTGGRDRPGDWIFSGSLNAGLQISPWKSGAFFVQPGVVYRLPNEKSPESYYTDHPVSFRIAAGYRVLF